jgi:hypothetical protein
MAQLNKGEAMKKISLYHYSAADIKDRIKVKYYGGNYYTVNDTKVTSVKRSFFYAVKDQRESFFRGAAFLYIVNIDASAVYDLHEDKRKLLERFREYGRINFDALLTYIKRLGYIGVKYSIGYPVVNLFKDVEYAAKIKLYN